jgi:hypothetical protein
MRYLFGLLCVCALGGLPLVGCDLFPTEGPFWDDVCGGVVCDDGNECTHDRCDCTDDGCRDAICYNTPAPDGDNCDFGGAVGVCISGTCEEDLWCGGVACNQECGEEGFCDFVAGACDYRDVIEDGTTCDGGFCLEGVCHILADQCTADDLAAIDAGDEPDNYCTAYAYPNDECLVVVTNCLQELSETSLSVPCLRCYALGACCMSKECDSVCDGPPQPGDDCDICIQEYCQPQVDVCIGGQ